MSKAVPKRMSVPSLPKGHMKTGHIQVKGNIQLIKEDSLDSGLTDPSVRYSLNKKARWRLVEAFRDDVQGLQSDNAKISAVEKIYGDENMIADSKEVAFHTFDSQKDAATHKYANKTFAQPNSLSFTQESGKSTKMMLPRLRRRKDHRNGGSMLDLKEIGEQENMPEIAGEVTFEMHTQSPSANRFAKDKEVNCRKYTKDRRAGRLQQRQANLTVEDWQIECDADYKSWEAEDMDVAQQVLIQDPTWELVNFDQLVPETMELDLLDLLVPGKVGKRRNKTKKRFMSECDEDWELV